MLSSQFSMVKWYLDCITESGEVAILYNAVARRRAIGISYVSYLIAGAERSESLSSMHSAQITSGGRQIVVDSPELKLCGEWTAIATEIKHTVFENEAGSVVWDCVQPGARVWLRVGQRELAGMGYAEVLTLTLPPWQLPLKHLKWGRFVSENDTLAWIDWQGVHPLHLVIHNGECCEDTVISDHAVSMTRAELRLDEPIPLRSGRVGQTVVSKARGLARLFPQSMLNIDERKWRSKATLSTSSGESKGWAIHEAVDWNL